MAPEENEETEVLIEKTKEEYEAERERDRKKHKEVLEMLERNQKEADRVISLHRRLLILCSVDYRECRQNVEVLQRDD